MTLAPGYVGSDPRSTGLAGPIGAQVPYVHSGYVTRLTKYGPADTDWAEPWGIGDATVGGSPRASSYTTVDPRTTGIAREIGATIVYVQSGAMIRLTKVGDAGTDWASQSGLSIVPWRMSPPIGSDGAQGQRGQDGADGEQGFPGQRGIDGAAGSAGPAGTSIPGQDGSDGDDGRPGQQGAPGVDGAAGPQGAQGPGVPGMTGDDGEPGPMGLPGATGQVGAPGAQGVASTTFAAGDEGEQGPIGPPGPPGAPSNVLCVARLAANKSIANTLTQVLGATSAANTLVVGTVIRFDAMGLLTNTSVASSSVITLRINAATLGATIEASWTVALGTVARTNAPFSLEARATVISIGASGTAWGVIVVSINDATALAGPTTTVTAAVTAITTQSNVVELACISGASTTTWNFISATMEILNP